MSSEWGPWIAHKGTKMPSDLNGDEEVQTWRVDYSTCYLPEGKGVYHEEEHGFSHTPDDIPWHNPEYNKQIVAYRVRPKTLTGETYLTALETDSPLMTNTPIKGMSCCIKGVYTVEFKDNKPVRMTWEASDAN